MKLYLKFGKRVFDLLVSAPILLLLGPVLCVAAILIRLDSAGPVLFTQPRLGKNGVVFVVYKFRTMTHRLRTPASEIVGYHPEVTRVGYWLRRFKIDECLQLLNVLKGEMSLVGPRPALPDQLQNYDALARTRLLVRPGLTGLAQVNGNIHLSWPERWRYDAEYVRRMSLKLDLWIIWRTVAVVVLGEDRFLNLPPASTLDSQQKGSEKSIS